jgi:two-component sensor histidine kinase
MKKKLLFSFILILCMLGVNGQTKVAIPSKPSKSYIARVKILQTKSSRFNHKRGAFAAYIDSAIRYGQLSLALSERYGDINLENESLCLIGEAYYKSKNKADGTNYFNKAIKNCQSLNDHAAEGKTLLRMSNDMNTYALGQTETSVSLEHAIDIFFKINDEQDLVDAYQANGSEFLVRGNLDSAKIYLYKSLSIAENIKRKDRYKIYQWLSFYYNRLSGGNFRALEFIQKALQNAIDLHVPASSIIYGDCYKQIGTCVYDGSRNDAYPYFDKAINAYKKSNDENAVYELYRAIGIKSVCLVNEGKPQEALNIMTDVIKTTPPVTDLENGALGYYLGLAYSRLNKPELAEKQYMASIAYYHDYPSKQEYIRTALMRLYSETQQYEKLKAILAKSNKQLQKTLSFTFKPFMAYESFQLDSINGDYKSAINHFRNYKQLTDSVNNAEKIAQLNELQVKYETKEKEQAITALRNQVQQASLQAHIKETELQKVNLQRNIQQVKLQKVDLQHQIDQGSLQKMLLQRNIQEAKLKNFNLQEKIDRDDLQKSNLEKKATYCGLLVVLIILAIFYKGYRNKNSTNKMLLAKQDEINQQNIQLESLVTDKDGLLTEKDWLLKEVHHRVKNNLQIVMSLLRSQASYLDNKDAISAISESQNRVHAISLIHQSLYKENERFAVDMAPYISDLINNLKDCFDTYNRKIRFITDAEQFKFDIVQAVPLGLILNEAITNAIKYAFDENGGTIMVSMKKSKANLVLMEVSDDGKGINPHFELRNADSMGMEMMKGLSKQIGASLQIKNNNGTILTVEYPLKNITQLQE